MKAIMNLKDLNNTSSVTNHRKRGKKAIEANTIIRRYGGHHYSHFSLGQTKKDW